MHNWFRRIGKNDRKRVGVYIIWKHLFRVMTENGHMCGLQEQVSRLGDRDPLQGVRAVKELEEHHRQHPKGNISYSKYQSTVRVDNNYGLYSAYL